MKLICFNLLLFDRLTHVKKCRPVPGRKHRKSIRKMEAVFQPESLQIFSDKFRPLTGVFRCFRAVSLQSTAICLRISGGYDRKIIGYFLTNSKHVWMTYDHFLVSFSRETARKSPEEIRKRTIGILLPFFRLLFRYFLVGSSNFLGSFQRTPPVSGDRKHRPGKKNQR